MKQGSKESEVGETVEKGLDKIRAWWQREALPGVHRWRIALYLPNINYNIMDTSFERWLHVTREP
jgi:hypothetical protein